MKRNVLIWLVLSPIIGFAFSSCSGNKEQAQSSDFGITTVKVAPVVRGEISNELTYTGTIEAWKEVDVVPDISGKIARIYVQEGDRVKKGQVLAELDTRATELQLEQAKAGLAVAKANFNDAQKNWERMQELHEKGTVSPQQFEKIKLAYEAAQAQLQQAEATLHLAEYQLDVSRMKAPFSGVITARNKREGDVINPLMGGFGTGGSGVVTLMDISTVKINFEVPPSDINKIKSGQEAGLRIESLPEKNFMGEVSLVNLAADPLSKTFKVQVMVPNPDLALKPGIFGRVSVKTETHKDALLIPSVALLDEDVVFVVRDGKALQEKVVPGVRSQTAVEILKGLQEGELVVIEGNYGLEHGTPVRIVES